MKEETKNFLGKAGISLVLTYCLVDFLIISMSEISWQMGVIGYLQGIARGMLAVFVAYFLYAIWK